MIIMPHSQPAHRCSSQAKQTSGTPQGAPGRSPCSTHLPARLPSACAPDGAGPHEASTGEITAEGVASWKQMSKSPLSRRFPVTVTRLPVTRCQVCDHTVAYWPAPSARP